MAKNLSILLIYLIFSSISAWSQVINQPKKNNLQSEGELSTQLTMKGSQLGTISDLGLFTGNTAPPLRVGLPQVGDLRHQTGVQIWVNAQEISSNTLVISDTGHDIAILYQLMKNQKFSIDFAFYYPKEYREDSHLFKGAGKRILSQAQMYGAHIQKFNVQEQRPANLYFIGIDAHRSDSKSKPIKLPIDQMPKAKDLKRLNIKKVIFLLEANPAFIDTKRFISKDMVKYLRSLETSAQQRILGVDCRSFEDFGGHAIYGRLADGCTGPIFRRALSPE